MSKKIQNMAITFLMLWIVNCSVALGHGEYKWAAASFIWGLIGAISATGLFWDEIEKGRTK